MTETLNGQKPSDVDQVHTTDLKNKFKARSIPLEQDFHDLIDMADAGRLAAGLSPEQAGTKDSARTGLILDADKRLAVKPKIDGGLIVAADGVSVKKGNGIDTGADGVSVKVASKRGISVTGDGLALNTDETLIFNSSGQVAVSDVFLRNTGNSSITGGNLSISSDGNGVEFMGGGKIIKIVGDTVCWHKESSGARPKLCDHDGSNRQDIATMADLNELKKGLVQDKASYGDLFVLISRLKEVIAAVYEQAEGRPDVLTTIWKDTFAGTVWAESETVSTG